MSGGRPDILFPLFAGLETLAGVGPKTAKAMAGLNVERPRDLLFTLPHSVIDRRRRETVQGAHSGEVVTVEVTVLHHQPPARKGLPYRVMVEDDALAFQLVFFRGAADWIEKQLPVNARRLISGKVEMYDGQFQMPHPDHILEVDAAGELPKFEPVYPLTAGVTQKVMAKAVAATRAWCPQWTNGSMPTCVRARDGPISPRRWRRHMRRCPAMRSRPAHPHANVLPMTNCFRIRSRSPWPVRRCGVVRAVKTPEMAHCAGGFWRPCRSNRQGRRAAP